VLGAALVVVASWVVPAPAHAVETLTVWVSTQGSDANNGLTPSTPFRSLQRASDFLCGSPTTCTPRNRPVVVRLEQRTWTLGGGNARASVTLDNVEPGTSVTATGDTVWHYYDPVYTTTLQPWSYQPGDSWKEVAATGGRPTFDGQWSVGIGLLVDPIQQPLGAGSTNLRFVYLQWQRFVSGGVFLAGRVDKFRTDTGILVQRGNPAYTVNGAYFYGVRFFRIGNFWVPTNRLGYGGLLTYNARNVRVRNSHFAELQNKLANQDSVHIHAIYAFHDSDNLLVEKSAFVDVTGDAVRQRNHTYGEVVRYNTFRRAGASSFMDDWYCRPNTPDTWCYPKEYRSYRGVFGPGNVLYGLYPQGLTGRRTVYCYDIFEPNRGLCPRDRIALLQ
jgi:hypothetical protein